MVRKGLISCLCILMSFCAFTIDQNPAFQKGIDAFNKKDFAIATNHFEEELKNTPNNVSAQFNLGLSHSAQKNYGKAIVAFERVLKQMPMDYKAIDNIKYLYEELNNGEEWTSDISPLQRALYAITSTTWSYISIILSILFTITLHVFRSAKNHNKKRLSLLISGLLIALLFFSLYTASEAYQYETSRDIGIVTNIDQSETHHKKSDESIKEKKLPIGTKVKRIGLSKGKLQKVQTKNGATYYIRSSEIEFI